MPANDSWRVAIHGFPGLVTPFETQPEAEPGRDERRDGSAGEGVVPLVEACPSCGAALSGQRCKVYCVNETCALYRCIIENCAGD